MNTMDFLKLKTENGIKYDEKRSKELVANYQKLSEVEKNELYCLNAGLVYYMVDGIYHKNELTDSEFFDELVAIGFVGLQKSLKTFKPEYKFQFCTYASICIRNEILMYLRHHNRKVENEISMEVQIIAHQDESLTLEDRLPSKDKTPKEKAIENENKERLYQAFMKLSKEDQEFLIKFYGLGDQTPMRQQELAGELHITQSYVSRKRRMIVKKLQRHFGVE